jgi:uncharacterized membrane protein
MRYTPQYLPGIIALLVAVFPTHFIVSKSKTRMGLPVWALLLRMPLQLLLMCWVYQYTFVIIFNHDMMKAPL